MGLAKPGSRVRLGVIVLAVASVMLLAAAFGCASPARRVLTSVNAYHNWLGEYEARCGASAPAPAPADCSSWYSDLRAHKARLEAAEAAIKRGGKLPLQLRAMKSAEKAAGRS